MIRRLWARLTRGRAHWCVVYDGIHVPHSNARTAAWYAKHNGGTFHWHIPDDRS